MDANKALAVFNVAQRRRAGDRQEPTLVPRCGHWRRLTPGVGGAADKAAHLMGWKSPYRQLPDSDGEHIRGMGRQQTMRGSDGKVTAAIRWLPYR
jgi:hypothetical protein